MECSEFKYKLNSFLSLTNLDNLFVLCINLKPEVKSLVAAISVI